MQNARPVRTPLDKGARLSKDDCSQRTPVPTSSPTAPLRSLRLQLHPLRLRLPYCPVSLLANGQLALGALSSPLVSGGRSTTTSRTAITRTVVVGAVGARTEMVVHLQPLRCP